MHFGGIALVLGEAVAGIIGLHLCHFPIAGHLGEDRGGGDGGDQRVAFDDGL